MLNTIGLPGLLTLSGLTSTAGVLPPLLSLYLLAAVLPPPIRLMFPPAGAERAFSTR